MNLRDVTHSLCRSATVGRALVSIPLKCVGKSLKAIREFEQSIARIADLGLSGEEGSKEMTTAIQKETDSTLWFVSEMDLLKHNYRMETGQEPIAWIMGMREYHFLKDAVFAQMTEEQRERYTDMTHFHSLPIRIKASRGIELEMDIESAEIYEDLKMDMKGKIEATLD